MFSSSLWKEAYKISYILVPPLIKAQAYHVQQLREKLQKSCQASL
jgi:hypothetical protein